MANIYRLRCVDTEFWIWYISVIRLRWLIAGHAALPAGPLRRCIIWRKNLRNLWLKHINKLNLSKNVTLWERLQVAATATDEKLTAAQAVLKISPNNQIKNHSNLGDYQLNSMDTYKRSEHRSEKHSPGEVNSLTYSFPRQSLWCNVLQCWSSLQFPLTSVQGTKILQRRSQRWAATTTNTDATVMSSDYSYSFIARFDHPLWGLLQPAHSNPGLKLLAPFSSVQLQHLCFARVIAEIMTAALTLRRNISVVFSWLENSPGNCDQL